MGFIYNGGQPDITFAAPTPRGKRFLHDLRARALTQKDFRPDGTFGEGWNRLEQLVNIRQNVPVPRWAVYGPPVSRPLNPSAARNMQQLTTLGLWQQLRQSGNTPYQMAKGK